MDILKFAITKAGQVYHQKIASWIWLGHIATVVRDGTTIARQVLEWWHNRLASDGPTENLVLPHGGTLPVISVSATSFELGWQPNPEPVEAVLAAA